MYIGIHTKCLDMSPGHFFPLPPPIYVCRDDEVQFLFIRHKMRWHFCSSQSPPGQERSWSFFEKVSLSLRRVLNIQRPALFFQVWAGVYVTRGVFMPPGSYA